MTQTDTPVAGPTHGVAAGLYWVRGELEENLKIAGQLVEQHCEDPLDPGALNQALTHLHEVRGAAVLIQAYGVALLAEEIKQTVQDLIAGRVHEIDPAYAAVVSACVQATDYLDLLLQGQPDCVLVLQPIINELRLSRGKSLLTEDDLFVAQFRVLGLGLDWDASRVLGPDAQSEALRLTSMFSSALLAWFKEQDSARALSRIGRICELLGEASRERALHQLWRTAAACVEALLSKTLDETLELKRQFGRAGQLLKILAESGEAVALRQMSDVSLRLLFYVGRSRGTGARVMTLRRDLQLDTWLPSVDAVQLSRARLRGANTGLLGRVAEELRVELAEVRDGIDLALRSGASQEDFENTAQRLKRVADTLLVLGLSSESQALAQPVETLREASGQVQATPQAWLEFATAVLQVDQSLDAALYRQLRAVAVDGSAPRAPVGDLRDGTAAVLRESLINVARIKTYIEAYIKAEDVLGLPEAVRLLDEIAAGFRILDLGRAEDLVLDMQRFLQSPEFASVRASNTAAGRFADAIAAVEYYLEFRRDASPGAERVLSHLETLVGRLSEKPEPEVIAAVEPALEFAADLAPPVQDVPQIQPFELALLDGEIPVPPPVQTPPAVADEWMRAASTRDLTPQVVPSAETLVPAAPPVEAAASEPAQQIETVDPEIRDVFIEEADEVLQTLQQSLPRWLRQTDDRDLLNTIRRGFHTLKGSGRMVRADDIGEFSWAMENLLNRALDRTLEISTPLVDTLRDAVGLLPALIQSFREHSAPPAQTYPLAEVARQLAAGLAASSDSAELLAVFRGDAMERLKVVMRWVAEQNRAVGGYAVPDAVLRAFHTLRGAALAIGIRPVGEVAGGLEAYLETLQREHQRLSDAGLDLVGACCAALGEWIEQWGQPGAPTADAQLLLARIDALRAEQGQNSAANVTEQQLVEIFSLEALDLIQRFESDLQSWERAPDTTGHVRALRAYMHTLKGAAAMATAGNLADLAEALNQRLGSLTEAVGPKSGFFADMKAVVAEFYLQLDAYREGRIGDGIAFWLARIAALDVNSVKSEASRVAAPDRELLEIFLHEGEELVEEIERHAVAIVSRPDDSLAAGAWQRALHTLKGSARVAGLQGIGDVAHWLETATEDAQAAGLLGGLRFRTQMRAALDGLHESLDEVRVGSSSGAFERVKARYDAASLIIDEPPMAAELEIPAAATQPDVELEEFFDPADAELVDIFAPEAKELIESLLQALNQWRQAPHRIEFAREIQRDLHTFKGGARLAGLRSLGDAAHRLESEVLELEHQGVDAQALQRVEESLSQLQQQLEPDLQVLAVAEVTAVDDAVADTDAVAARVSDAVWDSQLFWTPDGTAEVGAEVRREAVRVPVDRLDTMLNQAGEISIYRSRLEENHATLSTSLSEMAQTITRVREQLRLMDIETEAQIAARGVSRNDDDQQPYESEFDALEMDRYSRMQELSRALAESLSDLTSLHASLDTAGSEAEVLLQQQQRISTEVQQGLMGTLMVPFSRQVQRLARVVRQTAEQNGKQARVEFSGAESELDRNVLERMTAPLEHLLRNAVVHGVESPAERVGAGKPIEGVIRVGLRREGSQLVIEVQDDGRGLDLTAIRVQAVRRGLMRADAVVSDDDLARFVFEPGFSTAGTLTQDAGRGIGTDVVAAEAKQLGGTVDVLSETGRGTRFRIRLPLMLTVSQALVVQVGEELFAVPLSAVEGIARASRESLTDMLQPGGPALEYGGEQYEVSRLGDLVGIPTPARLEARSLPAILMRLSDGLGGGRRVAVVAERLIGNREIVTKAAGPILGSVAGISGATILADGRVMLIVDVPALIQEATRRRLSSDAAAAPMLAEDSRRLIMVVDDSITIRRVTERLLSRKGFRVVTAKDGLDAMASLQTEVPDAVLLDIEMPRADGFEVAAFIRNTPRTANLPIIMITSRSGDKHREHARQLGVDRYMIKPYQEDQLMFELHALLDAATTHAA
ncbi:MAG: Hpt domain-containing protein [Panacagrimonas sp.]